jgi:hypothetical protein
MSLTEELARLRVKEAIQEGLREQHIRRSLPPRKKSVPNATLLMICLALLLAISLGVYLATARTLAPTELEPTATAEPARPP